MGKLAITIYTDNAAFGETDNDEALEVARILNELKSYILINESVPFYKPLKDTNGNTVGNVEYTDELDNEDS